MNRLLRLSPGIFLLSVVCVALTACTSVAQNAENDTAKDVSRYETGRKTFDGIGKYYFGREIAHYMTHLAAPWLDRPERDQEERPDLVMAALALKPGDVVADRGCGTGYFSWRMARAVGAKGVVFGVEIQPEMLDHLAVKMKERGVTNVVGVLGTVTDPKLPKPVDLVIMVDVYHEFDHPYEMMSAVARQLKPGGRVAFVEYRGEDPEVPIKPLHKMTEAQVKKEMTAQPLEYLETIRTLPRQHIILFRKRAEQGKR
ncbi:MAG: class I SAM-dependent methyltransferase [Verrucomicrobia bacterium]|nr:class I SAM-dependent methyltransferase [Verrucomicrobiota bacterium]